MIEAKKFEIAVILINFNSSSYTINCVNSIIESTSVSTDFQIIVIDNCSEKEDYNKLGTYCQSSDFKALKLVRNNINVGFGAGNMLGVHYANANYYAFINNDSILLNDCITILNNAMKNNSNYGVCGPMAFKENKTLLPVLDHFTSPIKEIVGRSFLETINPKKYPNRRIEYTQPQQAEFISGSFIMIKAEDFHEVGGFDTNLFLYYEETDLCKRLSKINKFTFLIPDAKYIHFHGASTAKSIAIKTELKISLLYIIRKHYGFFWYLIILNKMRIQYFFKSFFKPSYWKLFAVLLAGAPLSKSLKVKQKIKSL